MTSGAASPDFEVLCGSSSGATASGGLADAGRNVALVLAATDLPDGGIGGVELLADVRRRHPQARRLLLVDRPMAWSSGAEAMVLGHVDSYVFVPWAQREPWLYLPVTEALADWERSQPDEQVAATIVGEPASRRAYELRDIFSRASIRTSSSTGSRTRAPRCLPTTADPGPTCRCSSCIRVLCSPTPTSRSSSSWLVRQRAPRR